MLTFVFLALAVQGTPTAVAPEQVAPEIVIKGKPKLVCSAFTPTGTRVGRKRRCVTPEQAIVEREIAREAAREQAAFDRQANATDCARNPTSICE